MFNRYFAHNKSLLNSYRIPADNELEELKSNAQCVYLIDRDKFTLNIMHIPTGKGMKVTGDSRLDFYINILWMLDHFRHVIEYTPKDEQHDQTSPRPSR